MCRKWKYVCVESESVFVWEVCVWKVSCVCVESECVLKVSVYMCRNWVCAFVEGECVHEENECVCVDSKCVCKS